MPKSPRVLLAAESLMARGSGIGRVARLMALALRDRVSGTEITAQGVTLNDPQPAMDLAIPTRTVAGSRPRFVLECQLASLDHTHFLYDFAGMARAHRRFGPQRRPFLVWIHGVDVWEEARRDRLVVAGAASLVVSNTHYTRERANRLHGIFGHARVCWLGTEQDEPPARRPDGSGLPTVLILARIDADGGYKGHRELIEAWPAVVQAVPDARLVIAGGGPGAAAVEALVRSSPACRHIELRGFVAESELPALWSETAVFAMPSRGEGFGLAYIEAMRQGIPVVASVHDAAPEINLDGVTGFNVDLTRPGELAERLIALLRDRDRATEMGRAGQARWREHFTYSAFARRFAPILDELLAR